MCVCVYIYKMYLIYMGVCMYSCIYTCMYIYVCICIYMGCISRYVYMYV